LNIQGLIIVAAVTMLALAVGIVLFVIMYQRRIINHQQQLKDFNRRKQEELMQASIRSEEEERMRIAAELHDDVGATLSSIRLMLQAPRKPGDDTAINYVKELLDATIQKVRNISHQLQPGTLQYLGLIKSIQSLAEMLTHTGQITVRCSPADEWPKQTPPTELALYRVVQELLTNITKHSGASKVTISTAAENGTARIFIRHNGVGMSQSLYQEMLYKKGAIGLKNIESRLKSAGATIAFAAPEQSNDEATIMLSLPALNNQEKMS
jgi:signal transduction histidine kinase